MSELNKHDVALKMLAKKVAEIREQIPRKDNYDDAVSKRSTQSIIQSLHNAVPSFYGTKTNTEAKEILHNLERNYSNYVTETRKKGYWLFSENERVGQLRNQIIAFKESLEFLWGVVFSQYDLSDYNALLKELRTNELIKQEEENDRLAEEERKRKEIERRNALSRKFTYFSLGGFNAAYLFDYYPQNRYLYVDSTQEHCRQIIWEFKKGDYSIGLKTISDFLEGNYTQEQMKNLAICVIPASKIADNDLRYKTMCSKLGEKYPITNGFSFISIRFDRNNSRNEKSSDTTSNLSFSDSVSGKDIILFDDITTRGTSFIQVAQKLFDKGARSVVGLFLGKTVNMVTTNAK